MKRLRHGLIRDTTLQNIVVDSFGGSLRSKPSECVCLGGGSESVDPELSKPLIEIITPAVQTIKTRVDITTMIYLLKAFTSLFLVDVGRGAKSIFGS